MKVLEVLKQGTVDLILMDVQTPEMDGLELIDMVEQKTPPLCEEMA